MSGSGSFFAEEKGDGFTGAGLAGLDTGLSGFVEACLTGVSTDFSSCLSLTVGVFGEGVAVEGDTTPSVDKGLASTTVMTGFGFFEDFFLKNPAKPLDSSCEFDAGLAFIVADLLVGGDCSLVDLDKVADLLGGVYGLGGCGRDGADGREGVSVTGFDGSGSSVSGFSSLG